MTEPSGAREWALLPCPFCGQEPCAGNGFMPAENIVRVWCSNSDCYLQDNDLGFTPETWNKRTASRPCAETAGGRAFVYLARQFDLAAKGCRRMGLDSWEDEFDSHRQAANRGEVDAEYIARMIDYDYQTGQDPAAGTKLLIEALCKDLLALSAAPTPPTETGGWQPIETASKDENGKA